MTPLLASLYFPDFDCQQGFVIEADASVQGAGGYIYQRKTGRPIRFFSHSFGPAGVKADNINREAAALIYAVTKFSRYIMNSKSRTKVYTDSKVVSYLKTATAPKLCRWRALLEFLPIDIHHRKGELLKVPDGLSRLIPTDHKNDKAMVPVVSEVLSDTKEYVISNVTPENQTSDESLEKSDISQILYLNYLHSEMCSHTSPERMAKMYPNVASIRQWREISKNCPLCLKRGKVKRFSQIHSSTSDDISSKNQLWFADLVFPKIGKRKVKKTVLSCIDVVTKFAIFVELKDKNASTIIRALKKVFSFVGPPKKIRIDQEKSFVSKDLISFCDAYNCEVDDLARAASWSNRVERVHSNFKDMLAKNPSYSIEEVQEKLNNLPLVDCPSDFNYTPRELHNHASQDVLDILTSYLKSQRKKRELKQIERRGNNSQRFMRSFQVGDCVRSNKLNSSEVEFGQIVQTIGNKIVVFDVIGKNKRVKAHVCDVEKVNYSAAQLASMNF